MTKIRRLRDGRLVGAAGYADAVGGMFDWVEDRTKPRPEFQKNENGGAIILEVGTDGVVWLEEAVGRWKVEDPFVAIGNGRDFAMAAMACGKTAREAVEIAARFEPSTGNGIDELTLPTCLATAGIRGEMRPELNKWSTAGWAVDNDLLVLAHSFGFRSLEDVPANLLRKWRQADLMSESRFVPRLSKSGFGPAPIDDLEAKEAP